MNRSFVLAAAALATLAVAAPTRAGTVDAGRGPIVVHEPPSYDGSQPTPVIILLHGYSSSGAVKEAEYMITPLADEYGFLYLYPDGVTDFVGNRYWNATDACCDLFNGMPDDSTYLRAVIDAVKAQYNVDDNRVHFFGHSNGGFMSYRMACDHADVVASIASAAGATWLNENLCAPSEPVPTLQIHGTADAVIQYGGGMVPLMDEAYPGAVETVETWATYDGCTLVTDTSQPNVDLVADIPGPETMRVRYADQCALDSEAELWIIPGGAHSPLISDDFSRLIVEWLLAHPRPAAPEFCAADITSAMPGVPDGNVDALDFLLLISQWGSPCAGSCEADITGPGGAPDGNVDALDYLLLIAQWGSPGVCPGE